MLVKTIRVSPLSLGFSLFVEPFPDHNMVFVPCYTTDEAETLDPFLQGQPGEEESEDSKRTLAASAC